MICGQAKETITHLFFQCLGSKNCLQAVKQWLQWKTDAMEIQCLFRWIQRAKTTKYRKKIMALALTVLVYELWSRRNKVIWRNENQTENEIVQQVKRMVKLRVSVCNKYSEGSRTHLF